MQKRKFLANPNSFGLRKCIPSLDVFRSQARKLWAFEVLK